GLGIVMDMVLNHTSDRHPWFQAALDGDDDAASRYIFHDPNPDGTPPNNWMSFFGDYAWEWCPRRSQWYMHQYHRRQPSLNMRCELVHEDHAKSLAFWRERGVAGFRFDTVTAYLFDREFRDNPPARPAVRDRVAGPNNSPYSYQDHVHDILPGDCADFMEVVRGWAGSDMWLIGECTSGNQAFRIIRDFTGPERLDAVYVTLIPEGGASPATYGEVAEEMGEDLPACPWWFGSHDQPRMTSSLGDGSPAAAMCYNALLSVLPGTVMMYQGDELGLPQPELEKEEITDPFDLRFWPDAPGREGARVPLPWTEAAKYGFTDGTPWLPMRWADGLSVEAQENDPDSPLALTRAAFALRREAGFAHVTAPRFDADGAVLTVRYEVYGEAWCHVFNLSPETVTRSLKDGALTKGHSADALGPWGFVIGEGRADAQMLRAAE
ncbi:MAG: alpha-amylase family glycosyl hydrolase, partial [Shimia sp.]